MNEEIYRKFLNTVMKNALLDVGDRVVAGLSGGADSVCLLLLLKELAVREFDGNLKIIAVHFNHGIRGEEADRDELFCVTLCKNLGIDIVVKKGDVPRYSEKHKMSLEEAARKLRYEAFNEVCNDISVYGGKTPLIAVAHNKSDRAETVFFNIARGSSIEGLKGISYKRDNIVRPILDLERGEIERVCIEYGVGYRTDSTNFENDYTRNKIRNKILPYINEELQLDFSKSLLRLSEIASEENEYLKKLAAEAFVKVATITSHGDIKINSAVFCTLDTVIGRRVLHHALSQVHSKGEKVFKDGVGIDKKMIDRVYEYIMRNTGGGYVVVAKGVICIKTGNAHYLGTEISLRPQYKAEETENGLLLALINDEAVFVSPDGTKYRVTIKDVKKEDIPEMLRLCKRESNRIVMFDKEAFSKLQNPAVIRTKKQGDVFKPFNGMGQKPLRRFFTDCKIPLAQRENMPLLATGNEILHVFSVRRSDFASVHEGSCCAIIISVEELKE